MHYKCLWNSNYLYWQWYTHTAVKAPRPVRFAPVDKLQMNGILTCCCVCVCVGLYSTHVRACVCNDSREKEWEVTQSMVSAYGDEQLIMMILTFYGHKAGQCHCLIRRTLPPLSHALDAVVSSHCWGLFQHHWWLNSLENLLALS